MEGTPHDPRIQPQHHADADETEFLRDHRHDEVGVRLRQVEQLLDAAAEADAQPLATADGDQRVRQLIALAVRVFPRIEETQHPLHPVRRGHDQQADRRHRHQRQPGKDAQVDAAEEHDAHGDTHHHHQCAEVRLRQQQEGHHHDRHQDRQEALAETVQLGRLAHGVVGGVDHRRQLHHFRRLEIQHDQVDPAPRTVHHPADAGNQHQHQQKAGEQEKLARVLLPPRHRDHEGQCRRRQPDHHEHHVAHQVEVRAVGRRIGLGVGNRRREHHHQADRQQQRNRPHQRLVHHGDGGAVVVAAARGVHHDRRSACSCATVSTNTWARCA